MSSSYGPNRKRSNSTRHKRVPQAAYAPSSGADTPALVNVLEVLDISSSSIALHVMLNALSNEVFEESTEVPAPSRRKRGSTGVHARSQGPANMEADRPRISKPAFAIRVNGNPWLQVAHINITPAQRAAESTEYQAVMTLYGVAPGQTLHIEIDIFPEPEPPLALTYYGGEDTPANVGGVRGGNTQVEGSTRAGEAAVSRTHNGPNFTDSQRPGQLSKTDAAPIATLGVQVDTPDQAVSDTQASTSTEQASSSENNMSLTKGNDSSHPASEKSKTVARGANKTSNGITDEMRAKSLIDAAIHGIRADIKLLKTESRQRESSLMTTIALFRLELETGRKEDARLRTQLAQLEETLQQTEAGQPQRLSRLNDLTQQKQALVEEQESLDAIVSRLKAELGITSIDDLSSPAHVPGPVSDLTSSATLSSSDIASLNAPSSNTSLRAGGSGAGGVGTPSSLASLGAHTDTGLAAARLQRELDALHSQVEETEKIKRKKTKDQLRALEMELGKIEGEIIQIDKAERNLALAAQLSNEAVPIERRRSLAASLRNATAPGASAPDDVPAITPATAAAAAATVLAAAAASVSQTSPAAASPAPKNSKPFSLNYFRWGRRPPALNNPAEIQKNIDDIIEQSTAMQSSLQSSSNINFGRLFRRKAQAPAPETLSPETEEFVHASNASVISNHSGSSVSSYIYYPGYSVPGSGPGSAYAGHTGGYPGNGGYMGASSVYSGGNGYAGGSVYSGNPGAYSGNNGPGAGYAAGSNASLQSLNSAYSYNNNAYNNVGYGVPPHTNRRRAMSGASMSSLRQSSVRRLSVSNTNTMGASPLGIAVDSASSGSSEQFHVVDDGFMGSAVRHASGGGVVEAKASMEGDARRSYNINEERGYTVDRAYGAENTHLSSPALETTTEKTPRHAITSRQNIFSTPNRSSEDEKNATQGAGGANHESHLYSTPDKVSSELKQRQYSANGQMSWAANDENAQKMANDEYRPTDVNADHSDAHMPKDEPKKDSKLISSKRLLSPLSTIVKDKKVNPDDTLASVDATDDGKTPTKRPGSSSGTNFLTQSIIKPTRNLSNAIMKRSESGDKEELAPTSEYDAPPASENPSKPKKNKKKGVLGNISESTESPTNETAEEGTDTATAGQTIDPTSTTSWTTKIGSWSQVVRRPTTAGSDTNYDK